MSPAIDHAKASQLADDRPGREATDYSIGGNRFEPRSDVRRREHERFAREIAKRLDAGLAAGEFEALWIFASNPFLGVLKAQLSEAVDKRVRLALPRGLAEIDQGVRESRLAKRLRSAHCAAWIREGVF